MKKIIFSLSLLILTVAGFSQCFSTIHTEGFGFHNVAQKPDGSVWGWGYGANGQLGNTTSFDEYAPIQLFASLNWQKVRCGSNNTFAIKADGTLWGTGTNYAGNLGIGSTLIGISSFMQIGTANDWKDIIPNDFFTIGMKTDNSIWGWGQNDGNQMGNGTCCNNQLTPTLISAETDWKSIDGSDSRSVFAIKNNGTLWCWGNNLANLLGVLNFDVEFPTQFNSDTDWKEMSVGYDHMLILKTNNTLWSWGNGQQGATGDGLGTEVARFIPRQIGTATWQQVSAGARTSFGIQTDGTLWAWGDGQWGNLGTGNYTMQLFPVQIGTDTNWATVAAGQQHTIALKTDGSLWAWGNNIVGQLGDGTTTDQLTPIQIPVSGCTLGNDSFTFDKKMVTIYPNPAQNTTTIAYETNTTTPTIEIYTILGKNIANHTATSSKGAWQVNTSGMPSGVYIIVMKENDTILSQQKLLVE